MKNTCGAPCLVCAKPLGNFEPDGGNHPLSGLEFTTHGHYGSRLFDGDPGSLVVNICDDCLWVASQSGKVLHHIQPAHRPPRGKYKCWRASADTHPKDGDVEQAPLVSGAVPERQTPDV